MSLGNQIRIRRESIGISQPELADRCGWESQSRISNYEKNIREPKVSDLRSIAKGLNCTIYDLLEEPNIEGNSNTSKDITISNNAEELIHLIKNTSSSGQLPEDSISLITQLIEQLIRQVQKPSANTDKYGRLFSEAEKNKTTR